MCTIPSICTPYSRFFNLYTTLYVYHNIQSVSNTFTMCVQHLYINCTIIFVHCVYNTYTTCICLQQQTMYVQYLCNVSWILIQYIPCVFNNYTLCMQCVYHTFMCSIPIHCVCNVYTILLCVQYLYIKYGMCEQYL